MRALSINQPWAYCITHGSKRVENRVWNTAFRGQLLIHASKRYQTGAELGIHADSPEVDLQGMKQAPRGAIVGVCRLAACVPPGQDHALPPEQRVWADPAQFKFLLEDVRAFAQPIPYRGHLGIFIVPDAIVAGTLAMIDDAHD